MQLSISEWIYYTTIPALLLAVFFLVLLSSGQKRYRSWGVYQKEMQTRQIKKTLAQAQSSTGLLKYISPAFLNEEAKKANWDLKGTANLWMFLPPIAGACIGVVFQSPPVVICGIISGFFVPWYRLSSKKKEYQDLISEQVEVLIDTFSSSYSVTNNIIQSMEMALPALKEPLYTKWKNLVVEYKASGSLGPLLDDLEKDLNLEEFKMFTSVLKVTEKSGGTASETMKSVAEVISSKRYLKKEAIVESIQQMKSHQHNVILCVVMILVFKFVVSDYYNKLMAKPLGHILLSAMFLYSVWSIYQAKKVTDI